MMVVVVSMMIAVIMIKIMIKIILKLYYTTLHYVTLYYYYCRASMSVPGVTGEFLHFPVGVSGSNGGVDIGPQFINRHRLRDRIKSGSSISGSGGGRGVLLGDAFVSEPIPYR